VQDLLTERCAIVRDWLARMAEDGTPGDRTAASRVAYAIEHGQAPDREDLGWLAEQAAAGVLQARIAIGVLT
jgi:hypothetical protein